MSGLTSLPSLSLALQARGGPDGIAAFAWPWSWPPGAQTLASRQLCKRNHSRDKRTVADTLTKKKEGMLTFQPLPDIS